MDVRGKDSILWTSFKSSDIPEILRYRTWNGYAREKKLVQLFPEAIMK